MSRERRFGFGLATAVVLVAFVAFAVAELDPFGPRESLCDQAVALGGARLLEKADETFVSASAAGEGCDERQRLAIHRQLTKAEKNFTAAAAFAASAAPQAAAGKDKTGSEGTGLRGSRAVKARRAKLSDVRRSVDRYLAGLTLYPFDAAALASLREQLAALPTPRSSKTGAARCHLGDRLTRAGLPEVAAATVPQGMRLAHKDCAETLAKLNTRRSVATSLSLAARSLAASDGSSEAVRERYAGALLANAEEPQARQGIEGSIDDDSVLDEVASWLAGIPNSLKEALPWIATVAVGLLLLALLAWIGVRQLAMHSLLARRAFRAAGKLHGLSFLDRAATPEVKVTEFEGDDSSVKGADFAALLEAGLTTQAGREPFAFERLSQGRAPEGDEPSITKLLEEVPETKLLGTVLAAIGKLFRRRSIAISGRLIPNADDGAGVLLKLEGNGRAVDRDITLWERAFDPFPGGDGAARRLRLVPAATVWVRWHVAAAMALPKETDVRPWRADALFKTAVAWQTMGDLRRAEALYTEALEKDPGLLPAAHNLAVIDVHDGRYALAERRLLAMRGKLEGDEGLLELWPTLDTASLYTLALALAYPALDAGPGDAEAAQRLGAAAGHARTLLAKLVASPPPDPRDDEHPEREELESAIGPSLILLSSLVIRQLPAERGQAIATARTEGAGMAAIPRSQLGAEVVAAAPWRLIYSYLLKQPNVSRRSYYNLACYYTSLARFAGGGDQLDCLKLALKELEAAVAGGYLVDWAAKDPSLRPLAQHPDLGSDFAALLQAHAVPAHEAASAPAAAAPAANGSHDKGLLEIAQLSLAWARNQI